MNQKKDQPNGLAFLDCAYQFSEKTTVGFTCTPVSCRPVIDPKLIIVFSDADTSCLYSRFRISSVITTQLGPKHISSKQQKDRRGTTMKFRKNSGLE
jgi:hypothetical protein